MHSFQVYGVMNSPGLVLSILELHIRNYTIDTLLRIFLFAQHVR